MPDISSPPFGALLRHLRVAAGLSRAELAERAGLSMDGIAALETGRRANPRPYTVRALADALSLAEGDRLRLIAAARTVLSPAAEPPPGGTRTEEGAWGRVPLPPLPPTRLIGREREVAAIAHVLGSGRARLLTLTGPGGVGKTRLAIAAAEAITEDFPDGVAWVELAHLIGTAQDATPLVAGAIARALGTKEPQPQSLAASLAAAIGTRKMTLVLDNFEHLLSAAPLIAEVVAACPELVILVTSRQRLALRGEREFVVQPLAVPDGDETGADATGVSGVAAMRLFAERAVEVRGDFTLTEANAPAVALLCRQLDGLPLAIELAVRWVKVLSPDALVAQLATRLPLLTGGAADLPDRQRTMRGTIAWSYDLLEPAEQALFRRLAVFAGGFTLEAAEWVMGSWGDGEKGSKPITLSPNHPITLDIVASLVDKSLLRQVDGPASATLRAWEQDQRYQMLETVREYGLEQLAASGEETPVRRLHTAYFSALVEQLEPALVAGEAGAFWHLGAERDNLRAALAWLLEHEPERALRVASVLRDFWMLRGEFAEGRGWLESALERAAPAALPARAAALFGLGLLAQYQGDYPAARAAAEEARALARAQGGRLGMLRAEYSLSQVHRSQGRAAEAVACAASALALARDLGDPAWLGWCLERLGIETHGQGDLPAAEAMFEEALALFRALGGDWGEAHTLHGLAAVARDLGETQRAAALYGDCLAIRLAIDERSGLVDVLVGIADIAEATDQPEPAARLLGAVEALRGGLGYVIFGVSVALAARSRAALRERLGEARFAEAWDQGTRLTLAEAVAAAQAAAARSAAVPSTSELPSRRR